MINISNTFLYSIPPLSHLQASIFNASNNFIRNVWIDDLPQGITELNLEDNDIRSDGLLEDWPNTIVTLNLSKNPIYYLDQVDNWPRGLRSLNLSGSKIHGVFQSGFLPDTLEYLNISNTGISRIHKFPKGLKEFIAVNTDLRILPDVCNHVIEKIVVTQAAMTNWGLPFYWGKSLKFLDLNSNRIQKVPEYLPEGLEYMNLSANRIQYFSQIPKSLQTIMLNCNRILEIPPWFYTMDAKFGIQYNCLVEIPVIANCLTASYQWIGTKYHIGASSFQKAWYKRRVLQIIRILSRTARIKWELLSVAMHPSRVMVFQDVSREWNNGVC
jgi:Leucine-rich repeat (LRR) protein